MRLLLGRRGDLVGHTADGLYRIDDMLEGILCRLDLLQSQLAALTRLAHGGAGATGLGLQTGDQAADFAGRGLRARRQVAHLVGHHGKAPALLTGPRRLDGRIQGQQVGLRGDAADHLQHPANFLAVGQQLLHHLGQALDMPRQVANGIHRHLHHRMAAAGFALSGVGGTGRLHRTACHFVGSRQHLVHGRGHLIDLGLLLAHIAGVDRGHAGHARAAFVGRLGRLTHGADHLAHLDQQLIVGMGNAADLVIIKARLQWLGKISRADQFQAVAQRADAVHQPVHPGQTAEHHQQQDDQCRTHGQPALAGGGAVGIGRHQADHLVHVLENLLGVHGQATQFRLRGSAGGHRHDPLTVLRPLAVDDFQLLTRAGQFQRFDVLRGIALEQQTVAALEALYGLLQLAQGQHFLRHQDAFLGHFLAEHALRPGHVQLGGITHREEQHRRGQRRAAEDQQVGKEELRIDAAQAEQAQAALNQVGDGVEHGQVSICCIAPARLRSSLRSPVFASASFSLSPQPAQRLSSPPPAQP